MALCVVAVHLSAQEQLPKWLSDIQTLNPGVIDSILYYEADPTAPNTRTYVIYYNQPLNHTQSGSAHFPLRALITVPTDGDPTQAINHIYASGYSIMATSLMRPDSCFAVKSDCSNEIAKRYHANYIQIEHRYFQQSAPYNCWENLDDLRAEEAAADFHAFFEALKKVLKGKFVMSGVSKGGITTLLQHSFYPNDMDIFVPYSAPFFNTDRDTIMPQYWYTTGWSDEFQDMFMSIRRKGIDHISTIFPIFLKVKGGAQTTAKQDSIRMDYLSMIGSFGYQEHAYSDTATLRQQMSRNDQIMQAMQVEAYGDTVCAFMLSMGSFDLSYFPYWISILRQYPDQQQIPGAKRQRHHIRPFGITEQQWWGVDTINGEAYEYQAKRELGYFDFRFDMIAENSEIAAGYNEYWKQHAGCLIDLVSPHYRTLTFSPDLYNTTMAATQNATKPIVLLYGLDDAWAGAQVKDEFINGTNVQKFVLPAQNHLAYFSSNTDKAQCDAIRAILDGVLGSAQDIEYVESGESRVESRKILRDGQLYIERNGEKYDIIGRKVSNK